MGKTAKVKLEAFVKQVRRLLPKVKAIAADKDAPTLTLNRHCSMCEFRPDCQKVAEETDNLSLMRGMSETEVEKQRSRGISTVTQFSHTFHPGRRGKRKTGKARKHDHALQALAFRDKKVYVLDSPTIPKSSVALYLDVEGVPDRDFYYLIGLLAVQNGSSTFLSFWADDEGQQKAMWDACMRAITQFEDYTLYHYGSYEVRFLERMGLSGTDAGREVIDRIKSRSCNILSAIYSHIYFPTVSNGLKDIAGFLGSKWSADNASGIQSLAWRGTWELRKEMATKQKLVQYNHEDCLALQRVTEFITTTCEGSATAVRVGQPVVSPVSELQSQGFRFGKTEFFCPELAHINKCAYSDYQRERVYLRTSPAVRQSLRRKERAGRFRPKPNTTIECDKPGHCPACGSKKVHVYRFRRFYKMVFDLIFTRSGVKKWIVRYGSLRYRCSKCRTTFNADEYRTHHIFGPNLSCWALYHHIALRQSYEDMTTSLNDIFGFAFHYTILKKIKPRMADAYRTTVEKMKNKLRHGTLVHADETKLKLKSETEAMYGPSQTWKKLCMLILQQGWAPFWMTFWMGSKGFLSPTFMQPTIRPVVSNKSVLFT